MLLDGSADAGAGQRDAHVEAPIGGIVASAGAGSKALCQGGHILISANQSCVQ